jgi:hypothetical protein
MMASTGWDADRVGVADSDAVMLDDGVTEGCEVRLFDTERDDDRDGRDVTVAEGFGAASVSFQHSKDSNGHRDVPASYAVHVLSGR